MLEIRPNCENCDNRDKTSREFQKASSIRVHTPYSQLQLSEFSNLIKGINPKDR